MLVFLFLVFLLYSSLNLAIFVLTCVICLAILALYRYKRDELGILVFSLLYLSIILYNSLYIQSINSGFFMSLLYLVSYELYLHMSNLAVRGSIKFSLKYILLVALTFVSTYLYSSLIPMVISSQPSFVEITLFIVVFVFILYIIIKIEE